MEVYGTFGPACTDLSRLTEMFRTGMCGLRLNLSHRSLAQSRDWLELARQAAELCGTAPQILMDLQGPELRVGSEGLPVELPEGETLPLSLLRLPAILLQALRPGQELLLDDGKLQAVVGEGDTCRVVRGGTLLPRKSVAAPGLDIRLPALTGEDLENLRLAPQMGVTGVMQSFVRGREDLLELREALKRYGGEHIRIFAKVENRQGLQTLPEWIDLADCVVIARGDLGNAMPLWQLPAAQKIIAALCNAKGKPFLVVTQMLASMEHRAVPTRAEVSDIFNAVLDGASALMLTGETAAGNYPVEAMAYLCNTAREALRFLQEREDF
ncbi:MAG: pyruvate kinase [Clostridia bacterium]|nr:pyruvate kinase [Clostridia bacterium]